MNDFKHIAPFLVPIVAIVLGIALAMLGLWTDHLKKLRLLDVAHQERLKALEMGRELPELPVALIAGRAGAGGPVEPWVLYRRGLVWLLVGLALGLALWLNVGLPEATYALVPCAVGLANLLTYSARRQG